MISDQKSRTNRTMCSFVLSSEARGEQGDLPRFHGSRPSASMFIAYLTTQNIDRKGTDQWAAQIHI